MANRDIQFYRTDYFSFIEKGWKNRLWFVCSPQNNFTEHVLYSFISYRNNTWETDHWGALNCDDRFQELKLVQISSNHLSPLANCTIFSISKNSTNFDFKFLDSITKQQLADLSYVPTTKSELLELMKKIEASNLPSPTRKDF